MEIAELFLLGSSIFLIVLTGISILVYIRSVKHKAWLHVLLSFAFVFGTIISGAFASINEPSWFQIVRALVNAIGIASMFFLIKRFWPGGHESIK